MTFPQPATLDREKDNEAITLAEACKLYPRAKLTVSTLRAEAARGRLDIFPIGRRHYTTPEAMREMVLQCQEEGRRRAFTSTGRESSGLSATARASSARAALNQTLNKLKSNSRPTLVANTNQRAGQTR